MAGTTEDKIAKLMETKADLKSILTAKGIEPGDVLSTYPSLVDSVKTLDVSSVTNLTGGYSNYFYMYVSSNGPSTSFSPTVVYPVNIISNAVYNVGSDSFVLTFNSVKYVEGRMQNGNPVYVTFKGGLQLKAK